MSDETARRTYTKRRRAELEEETRRRIAASAAHLHGTVGPARTSISAVADHAGVRRSTVYRHFPDEAALFGACSAHFMAENPPPDPTSWTRIADPDQRLVVALGELYAYFRSVEPMLTNLLRDESLTPPLQPLMAGLHGFFVAVADILAEGRPPDRLGRAALGLATDFKTWRSLAIDQGLDDAEAVELMRRLAGSA